MTISKLLEGVKYVGKVNNFNCKVTNLTVSSVEVTSGSVFFAVKGTSHNGNDYIAEAFNNGAKLVISDTHSDLANVITVKNIRKVISKLAYKFYNPIKNGIKSIGVVGTNGNTSTTYILKNILEKSGFSVGVIGTLGIYYKNVKIEPSLTTPDAIYLYKLIGDMATVGVNYVIMELSAHAIYQYRANDIKFETLIFTNCTQDHLDYFSNFEEYKKVKLSVFTTKHTKSAVVNVDDRSGREIVFSNAVPTLTYGIYEPSDVFAINLNVSSANTQYLVNAFDDIGEVKTKLLGEFNVYNVLSSITTACLLGVSLSTCIDAVNEMKSVKGRLEFVENYNGADIFVDYAHTPDGLEKLLKTVKTFCKNKLYLVFGCGGNRDKDKREKMGKIAGEYADFTIITSDNPRFEEPYSIIRQIEKGIREKSLKYITIQSRYMATGYAISKLKQGDVLVIAGKGAEEYQDVMGVKLNYSDVLTVRDVIAKLDFGGELI